MKPLTLVWAFLCLVAQALAADVLIIYDKYARQSSLEAPASGDSANQRLHADVKAEPKVWGYDVVLPLVNAPEWGKTVSDGARGSVEYEKWYPGAFRSKVWVQGLDPNHEYVLALNGKPDLAGNHLLPDPMPDQPEERHYDFLTFRTDSRGFYQVDLAVRLRPGAYRVRLCVKDAADSQVVLFQDYFPFLVR